MSSLLRRLKDLPQQYAGLSRRSRLLILAYLALHLVTLALVIIITPAVIFSS